ncbi:MAG TPA: SemiSWEET family transporter [Dehalococcoidales bacterium]|nr:SemiSWEET family transporter [Dehalococcoidales bacterium]
MVDYVGYIAGLLVTFALVPQIMRVYKLKSAREISVIYNSSMLLGLILWLVYGLMLGLVPIIIWNIIGIVLAALLLLAKLKYGR